jgi:hypothetical protein
MYLNILAAWYLLFLTAPWLFTQPWMKGLEGGARLHRKNAAEGQNGENPRRRFAIEQATAGCEEKSASSALNRDCLAWFNEFIIKRER